MQSSSSRAASTPCPSLRRPCRQPPADRRQDLKILVAEPLSNRRVDTESQHRDDRGVVVELAGHTQLDSGNISRARLAQFVSNVSRISSRSAIRRSTFVAVAGRSLAGLSSAQTQVVEPIENRKEISRGSLKTHEPPPQHGAFAYLGTRVRFDSCLTGPPRQSLLYSIRPRSLQDGEIHRQLAVLRLRRGGADELHVGHPRTDSAPSLTRGKLRGSFPGETVSCARTLPSRPLIASSPPPLFPR
jgi:hypothetical protein